MHFQIKTQHGVTCIYFFVAAKRDKQSKINLLKLQFFRTRKEAWIKFIPFCHKVEYIF